MEPEGFERHDTHLVDHLRPLWSRKWLIVLVAGGVFGVQMWSLLKEQAVYESAATIQLGVTGVSEGLDPLRAFTAGISATESELEILRSRMLAKQAAVRLNKHHTLSALPPGVSLKVTGVAIADAGTPRTYTVTFIDDAGGYRVSDPEGRSLGAGRAGQPFEAAGVRFTLSDVSAKSGSSFQITLGVSPTIADSLRGGMVAVPIRGTNLVSVTGRSHDPQEAASLANAFAETYVEFTRQQRAQSVFSLRQFLEEQIEPFRKDLQGTERALTEYKASTGFLVPDSGLALKVNKIRAAELDREKWALQRREAETILDLLRRGTPQGFGGTSVSISALSAANQIVNDLISQLTQLEIERNTLQQIYSVRYPLVIRLEGRIAEVRKRLAEELQGTINTVKERERLLTEQAGRNAAELKSLPPSEIRLLDLVREAQVRVSLYTYLLQRRQDVRLAEASERAGARIIDRALVPTVPISPNVPRKTATGGALSLFIGVGLALLLNYLDRSVKDVKDFEARTGLPAFGVIPEIGRASPPGWARWQRPSGRLPDPGRLIMEMDSRAPAAEAYRVLRTNMQFALPEPWGRIFLFASAGPQEGKSLTVANLAIVFSQLGGRTLVVDADLRRARQHTLFGAGGEGGLTDVLVGSLGWRQVTRATRVEHLDLIPCGQIPPNPAELLGRPQMKEFLEEARQRYDLVLVDSPPVLAFTDACVLAPVVDGVFLVVRAGMTTPGAIARVQSLLGAVKARVVGGILNALPSVGAFGLDGYGYRPYKKYYHEGSQPSGEGDDSGWLSRIARRIQLRNRR